MTRLHGAARQAEAVVGVVEVGRDAGAGGAAGDFDVMAPTSAAGGFARRASRADFGAGGIAIEGSGVVIRIVPVAAPLVDVVAHVIEAEIVGGVAGDRLGSGLPSRGVIGERLRWLVAPGEFVLVEMAAGGALPLGFGGKAVRASGLLGKPVAVTVGVKPGDSGYGLAGMVEILMVPERWRVRRG